MALLTNRPNWTNLIKFTKNGIEIADYVETRAAIVNRLKEIFGQDIDVATNTADGQKIEMDTLIINNILQSIKALYANLDVDTAQGTFLDKLCKLSNVYRKPAQRSTTSLVITLTNANAVSSITVGPNTDINAIKFVDKNGVTWTWSPETTTVLQRGKAEAIVVTCDQDGKIVAKAGSISKTVDTTYIFTVNQASDAIIGTNEESDAELRARRNGSLSVNATTVLQSLKARLLDVVGIQDVLIYNNDSDSAVSAKDGTSIAAHNVYCILRYLDETEISDALVGSILYEYMTPGIHYNVSSGQSGSLHSYQYTSEPLPQVVNWKKAEPINPRIGVTLNKLTHYTSTQKYSTTFDVNTLQIIANNIKEYMNSLPLSTNVRSDVVKMQIQLSDPMFKGMPTFICTDAQFTDEANVSIAVNNDTFYQYSGEIENIKEHTDTIDFEII